MTTPISAVLLYSKYSENSKRVMHMLEDTKSIRPVCIDNARIRQRVMNEGITVVPALVIKYNNGDTEILDKQRLELWVKETLDASSENEPQQHQSSEGRTPINFNEDPPLQVENPLTESYPVPKRTGNSLSSIAEQMQKERDAMLEDKNPSRRPIAPD